ncbi:MAG: alpha/beta hydrolase [Deltaproteobacteria bacterium]|nr:alpha/beta hydrolase [Deltaproteobacteria bacterium]
MRHPIRILFFLFGACVVLGVASLGLGYAILGDVAEPPRTVVDDPSLPSLEVGGVKLHVEHFGDPARPTVVVIHGGPGNDFRYLLPLRALADEYFVVFYDQRGSGLSERVPDEALALESFYEELDGVVDRFAHGRPVRLLGHSWGAMLASAYLGQHPEKVQAAVLAEPGMLSAETAQLLMDATNEMRPPLGVETAKIVLSAWLRSLHVKGPDADARRDYLMGSIMTADFEGHPTARHFCGQKLSSAHIEGWRYGARVAPVLFAKAKAEDGRFQVDFLRGVERFKGPVLFLAGSCSELVGEAQQRRHMKSFPNAELVVIPDAGHTMFGERPEESMSRVRSFFARANAVAAR